MEAKTIKKLRKEQGLTQEQLGSAVGKSKQYIADLETGKRDVNSIAAETLVKIASELGTQAEYIINTTEHLDDDDFEWDKVYDNGDDNDYWLVVDELRYSNRFNQHVVCIDGTWYRKVNKNEAFNKSISIDRQLFAIKEPSGLNLGGKAMEYDCFFNKCVPKGGIDVQLRREITKSEFDKIIRDYNLTEDDISGEFIDKKGAIYGKYMKTYTAVQIRVDPNEAIPLETKLREQGIEAANIAPGRVNIRTK